MDIFLIYVVKALILPPASLIVLAVCGLLISKKRQQLGNNIIIISLLVLCILSLPLVSTFLASIQEIYKALTVKQLEQSNAQAIIVLGGGVSAAAPEYGNQATIKNKVFDRLRYTVRLSKKTGLPILATGGNVLNEDIPPEAKLIQDTLINDFHIKAKWLEDKSRNTAENAQFSYNLLIKEKISRIVLVTHALHMARAVEQFQKVGFKVTPAPTSFHSYPAQLTVLDFIPSANALRLSTYALHEQLGRWWYRLRYS